MEYPYNSSLTDGSDLIILARKQMINAWIVFIIISILLNVFFIAEWWSIAIRTSLIVYPIYKSVKYYRINRKEKKLKTQELFQKNNVKNTRSSFYSNSYDSSGIPESEALFTARKQMTFAWIVFIIIQIVLNVFFLGDGWSIATRSAIIVYPVYKSVKYGKIKEEDKKFKIQESSQNNYSKFTKYSYYGKQDQPTIITSHSKENSSFCPFCGSKHEREAVYCSACGTDLKLGA